jgi:hypothetical protein
MYWYKTKCKRMYNYRIQTNDLMHTILLIQLLCYKHEPTSVTVCFCMLHIHVCQHCCSASPCSWCQTSCAGPTTTPMLAMGRRPAPPHGLQDFTEAQVSHKAGLGTADLKLQGCSPTETLCTLHAPVQPLLTRAVTD